MEPANNSSELLENITGCPICHSPDKELFYENLADRMRLDQSRTWTLFRCKSCAHGWLSPRYTPENNHIGYEGYSDTFWPGQVPLSKSRLRRTLKHSYFSKIYGYQPECSQALTLASYLITRLTPGAAARFDKQVRYLPAKENGSLLDVGSGNGWFLENMKLLGWHVQGVDVDETSAQKVRDRGIKVDVGNLQSASYEKNSFDAITLSHVIEHLHDPASTLAECFRILKPGGTLTLFTPNINSFAHSRFQGNSLHLDPPRHLHLFSLNSLSRTLRQAGFVIEQLHSPHDRRMIIDTWFKSRGIRETGRYTQDQKGLLLNLLARLFGFAAHLSVLTSGNQTGEEIITICRKAS